MGPEDPIRRSGWAPPDGRMGSDGPGWAPPEGQMGPDALFVRG